MAVPEIVADYPRILFFDGVCSLCSGWVEFVYRRDPQGRIAFAPLQSREGAEVLRWIGLPVDDLKMMIFVENGRVYRKSGAFLKVVRHLSFPWNLLQIGWLIPVPVRDWLYDRLAAVRYRLFGKLPVCLVPTWDLAERFAAEGDKKVT